VSDGGKKNKNQQTFTSADLAADRARALEIAPVSHETAAKLDVFVEHLLRVAPHLNLIARSTLPNVWTRHVADSLQLLPLAPDANCWIDLGSGAGFPGLVIACALAGRAGAVVHLVESIGKKAAFLREAVNLLQVPCGDSRCADRGFREELQDAARRRHRARPGSAR
jgi:16S rRNA (guanine527-N7)-methyltransferase